MAAETKIPTLYFQYWEKEVKFVLMDKYGDIEDDSFNCVNDIMAWIGDKWDSGDEFLVHFMLDKED